MRLHLFPSMTYLKWIIISIALFFLLPGCSFRFPSIASSGASLPQNGTQATYDPSTGLVSASLNLGTLEAKLQWGPNREATVNRTGGGYRLFYQTNPNVDTANSPFIEVPFFSGSQAPSTLALGGLAAGTYYFKLVAFGSLKGVTNLSSESAEVSISLP
ncbi:MAG: hypothetical protein HYR96_05790 [Deltaproteobacteria bacterium]|nr:hypothetical protein [Deltaproteobacteria bacterium]